MINHKFRTKSPNSFYKVIACFLLTITATVSHAGDNSKGLPIIPVDKSVESNYSNGSVPGEVIDPHTGKMYHEVVDMVIPGEGGLDIKITRAYQKSTLPNYSVPHAMGNWEFTLPTLTENSGGAYADNFKSGSVRYNSMPPNATGTIPPEHTGCLSPSAGVMSVGGYQIAWRPWLGLKLDIPGDKSRNLLITKPTARPDYSGTEENPSEARWVSNDGWKSSCIYNNKNDWHLGHNVYSPNGVQYLFQESVSIVDTNLRDVSNGSIYNPWSWNWINYEKYYPTKIIDENGNWLEYEYTVEDKSDFIDAPQTHVEYHWYYQRLSKITASDGRVVNISYHPPKNIWNSKYPVYLIDEISYEGRVLKYIYNDDNSQLERVILPNGNEIKYGYVGNPKNEFVAMGLDGKGNWNTVKPVLDHVEFPTGGRVDYTYVQRNVSSTGGLSATDGTITQEKYQAVKTKTLSGPSVESGTWTYTYSSPNSTTNRAVIEGPDNLIEMDFERDGTGADSPLWGGLKAKRVKSKDGSTLVEEQTYHYKIFDAIGVYTQPSFFNVVAPSGSSTGTPAPTGDPQSSRIKSSIIPNRVDKVTTTRGTASYESNITTFNIYFKPTQFVESSTTSEETVSRIIDITYHDIFDLVNQKWVIGLPDVKKVNGIVETDKGYDLYGNLETDSTFGVTTTYTYHTNTVTSNPTGDIFTITDANQHTTKYEDYFRGKPQKITNATLSEVTHNTVDTYGNVTEILDAKNNLTVYDYDDINRLILTSPPIHSLENVDFTDENAVVTTRGNYKKTEYKDGFGRVIQIKEEDISSPKPAIIKDIAYDALGRKSYESDPYTEGELATNIYGIEYTYDELGRNKTLTHTSDSSQTMYDWLDTNNSVTITDPKGNVREKYYRSYGKPGKGNLIKEDAEEGITLNITRDVFGKVETVSIGDYQRVYEYNNKQFLEYLTVPEIGKIKYGHDNVGNVSSKQILSSSDIIYFYYDELDRLEDVIYPVSSENAHLDYDANGNLEFSSKGGVTWDYTYDVNNNRQTATLKVDDTVMRYVLGYDTLDNLSSVEYPGGLVVNYEPDALGRATKAGAFVTSTDYYANGNIKQAVYGNNQILNVTQDSKSRTDLLTVSKVSSSPIVSLDYGYDLNGNTNWVKDTVTGDYRDLIYDGVNRLKTVNSNLGNGSLTYDTIGNIGTKDTDGLNLTYHYEPVTYKLTSITGSKNYALDYDVQGNLSDKGSHSYHYDYENNMTVSNGANIRLFTYDANNRMVKTSQTVGTIYSSYLDENKLFELNLDEDWQLERIYLNGHIVAERRVTQLSSTDTDSDGINDSIEWMSGLNTNDPADANDDKDGDGLNNLLEAQIGSSLTKTDSDGDTLSDYDEYMTYHTNPILVDSDNDNVNDDIEIALGRNPNVNEAALIAIISGLLLN